MDQFLQYGVRMVPNPDFLAQGDFSQVHFLVALPPCNTMKAASQSFGSRGVQDLEYAGALVSASWSS